MSDASKAMVPVDTTRTALEPRDFAEGMRLAQMVAKTGLYGVKTAEDAFMRMSTGMGLGLSAAQSLRGLFVISGKVGISADLMMGLALAHPECHYFRPVETTAQIATFTTARGNDPEVALSFSMADAQAAGLNSNGMYAKYPAPMLRARCAAALARLVYPEVMHGLYVREEMPERGEERSGPTAVSTVAYIVEQPADPLPSSSPGPATLLEALAAAIDSARNCILSGDDAALVLVKKTFDLWLIANRVPKADALDAWAKFKRLTTPKIEAPVEPTPDGDAG